MANAEYINSVQERYYMANARYIKGEVNEERCCMTNSDYSNGENQKGAVKETPGPHISGTPT